jgi:hypothetical protein
MPSKGHRKCRGKAQTRPQVKVVDLRDLGHFGDDLVPRLRRSATQGCLALDGVERVVGPDGLDGVEYLCDTPELTGFGGLGLFAQFAYGTGLADRVAQLPLAKRVSQYSPAKLCEVLIMLLAAGLERVSHVDDYTHDPGLCLALGLERLPDQATVSRFLSSARSNSVKYLREANQKLSREMTQTLTKQARLVVDCDTRVVGVYGQQEGSKRSPLNGGKPHFTFEIAALRNTHDILDGGLLEGVTHPAPLFAERFAAILKQLGGHTHELVVCADAAWFAASVFQCIEAADRNREEGCACKYAIRAQLKSTHLTAIYALPETAWRNCDDGVEIAEFQLSFVGSRSGEDPCERRHIVTRTPKPPKEPANGQMALMEAPAAYEYSVIVTSLDWTAKRVWVLYNHRATVESVLKEGTFGFHMDSLPSSMLCGNQLYCQLLIMAYNHVNLFRRLCLPEAQSKHYVQALRRILFAIPALVERTARGVVMHCAPYGAHVDVLPVVTERLRHWPAPGGAALLAPAPA